MESSLSDPENEQFRKENLTWLYTRRTRIHGVGTEALML